MQTGQSNGTSTEGQVRGGDMSVDRPKLSDFPVSLTADRVHGSLQQIKAVETAESNKIMRIDDHAISEETNSKTPRRKARPVSLGVGVTGGFRGRRERTSLGTASRPNVK